MLGRFILILVLVPIIELVLLNQLLQRAGLAVTLLLVFGTGIIGLSLARRQGMHAWSQVHAQMAGAKNPSQEIMSGVMILIAGALLMTPGIITDVVGFLLLVPAVRKQLGRLAFHWFKVRTVQTFQSGAWTVSSEEMYPNENPKDLDQDDEAPSIRVIDPEKDSA